MKIRRIVSAAMALLLVCAMPLSVMADDWDLSDGSIEINVDNDGKQTVNQTYSEGSSKSQEDSNPTINSSGETGNTIKVSTASGQTANATIDGVNIKPSSGSGIEVNGNLNLTVKGGNTINTSGDNAAIHVNDGDLTITGDGKLSATNTGDGAAIGSDKDEDMSGSITIQGNVTVEATNQANNDSNEDPSVVSSGNGTAIGSGEGGAMSGEITVGGNAQVTAKGKDGAAIGSGEGGAMSGDISVGGNANVTATGNGGAGIGSGYQDPDGDNDAQMSGSITINGNTTVNAESSGYGAAIGSGANSAMSGTITVGGNTNTNATSNNSGAGIGSGAGGAVSGSISINGNANVEANATTGAAIGSGDSGDVSADGIISIRGDSKVTAVNSSLNPEEPQFGASIGSGVKGTMKGTIEIGNRATLSGDGEIVIGAGTGGEMGGKIVYVTEPTATDADTDTAEPLYRVVDKDEKDLPFTATCKDGVLTVKCAREYATFLAKTGNLRILKAQGIRTIVFETEKATSTFALEDLLAEGSGTCYLTHDGATITFTLDKADVSDILK